MLSAMVHRGPDGGGRAVGRGVVMGARRLAVLDKSGGEQPMSDPNGEVVVVFNGEIYNHLSLRAEMVSRGTVFHTRSDTEVLIALWRERGPGMLDALDGMFVFCIHDRRTGEVFLARDRVGIKPLFVVDDKRRMVFASELRVLQHHPTMGVVPDALSLVEAATTQFVWGRNTVARDVKKLLPGESLHFTGRPLTRRSQSAALSFAMGPSTIDTRVTPHELLRTLEESVRMQLVADVPVGVFLSGGVDSASVLALAVRHATAPIETFTVAVRDGTTRSRFDESARARKTAQQFGSVHHELTVSGDDVARLLPEAIAHTRQPILDPAFLPTWRLAGFARERVTVALTGEGADELFAGYRRTLYMHRLRRVLAHTPRSARLASLVDERVPRARQAFDALTDDDPARGHVHFMASAEWSVLASLFDDALFRDAEARMRTRAAAYRRASQTALMTSLDIDAHEWLPHTLLEKIDHSTMASSLEARVPFLSNAMVALAARLSDRDRIEGFRGKAILRAAMRGVLDDELLSGPKRGFDLPVDAWLRGPLVSLAHALADEQRAARWPGLRHAGVRALVDAHLSGRREHGRVLFLLASILLWLEEIRA